MLFVCFVGGGGLEGDVSQALRPSAQVRFFADKLLFLFWGVTVSCAHRTSLGKIEKCLCGGGGLEGDVSHVL